MRSPLLGYLFALVLLSSCSVPETTEQEEQIHDPGYVSTTFVEVDPEEYWFDLHRGAEFDVITDVDSFVHMAFCSIPAHSVEGVYRIIGDTDPSFKSYEDEYIKMEQTESNKYHFKVYSQGYKNSSISWDFYFKSSDSAVHRIPGGLTITSDKRK